MHRFVTSGAMAAGCAATALAQPTIVEEGWSLSRDIEFTDPISAQVHPLDGLIYAGRRPQDVYRIDPDDTATKIAETDDVAGLEIDPDSGDLFMSEDFPGNIKRVDFESYDVTTWVTGFHSGDDDPAGIARVPEEYTGSLLTPGGVVSTDRGFNGPDEVWAWSFGEQENEVLVKDDDGTLTDPFDIAIKGDRILIADGPGGVWSLADDGSLSEVVPPNATIENAHAVVFDTRSDDAIVLDVGAGALLRLDAETDEASQILTDIDIGGTNWGNVNIHDDGQVVTLVVGTTTAERIYVYTLGDCAADFNGDGVLNILDFVAFQSAFMGQDPEADCDGNGQFSILDFVCYQQLFEQGCP